MFEMIPLTQEFHCLKGNRPFWSLRQSGVIIINDYLKYFIEFHNALHGLRSGRGSVTATFEAETLQQIFGMLQKPLYDIFLDLYKTYVALYR